jgi:ATP-dependent DNA helicase RecG
MDRVEVTVRRRIIRPQVIDFIARVDQAYQLTRRERITLGLLAQHDALKARDLARILELPSTEALRSWLGRLPLWDLVLSRGRTQATQYFIAPETLKHMDFPAPTTLGRIEPHRLRALIVEDLTRYPDSAIGEIQKRIGAEVPLSGIKRALDTLTKEGIVGFEGDKRWRRYSLVG